MSNSCPRCGLPHNWLKIFSVSVVMVVESNLLLPVFPGNLVRGILGNSLIKSFCTKHTPECQACEYINSCPYSLVFKTAHPRDFSGRSQANPFVIDIESGYERRYVSGDKINFTLTLMGSGCDYSAEIIHALLNYNDSCFRISDGTVKLYSLQDVFTGEEFYKNGALGVIPEPSLWSDNIELSKSEYVNLDIITHSPIQLLKDKVLETELYFPIFIDFLFRRIGDVMASFNDTPFLIPYHLLERKPKVEYTSNISKAMIPQGKFSPEGIVGRCTYSGAIVEYLPFILLGELIHIGKLTTRGFGKYVMQIHD